jgi:hypothetical protein
MWHSHTSIKLLPYSPASRQCNICEKIRSEDPQDFISDGEKYEPLTSSEPWYHALYSDIDVCSECYPYFYKNLTNTNEDSRYKYCDVCIQDIGENAYYTNEDAGYDVCQPCYNYKRPFGVNVNQSGLETDREQYIIAKYLDYDALTIPPQLLSEITSERNQLFIELLGSLVRLPDTYENILEWTLITDLTPCEHHDAECGFAINLINDKVASILSDNHGRVAMNVVYDNYEDYLREEAEFNQLNDTFAFNSELSLDDKEENTHNFGEYVRRNRGLSFYYG